jgi:TRAP-type C4-dicarboxylate transport system substrate-binding protein
MRMLPWVALLLGASLVLAGCGGVMDKAGGQPAPRKTMVLSLAIRADSWEVDGFADTVSRLSDGTLRIVVRTRWRYGQAAYQNGLVGDVRAGRADLGAAEANAWDSAGVGSFRALGAPLLIDSYRLQESVLESRLIPEMLRGLRPLGLVGLGVLPGQLPRPLGTTRSLLAGSEYAGARIGLQQSPVGSATMRALGATPDWVGGAAPITGLAGIVEPISWIQGSGYDRVSKYLTTNVVLWPRPIVVFANRSVFARLTGLQRRALEQAAVDDVPGQTQVVMAFERDDAWSLCADRRLRVQAATPAELATLRRAVRPVYEQLDRDPQTRRFIAQIQRLRARVGAPASVLPRCASAPSFGARGAVTPLDGVYALSISPGDLRPSQRLPEAYGSWQIALDRGSFRLTQGSNQADWFADGQVRISGDQMSWTVAAADAGGPHGAPDGVPLTIGQTLRFRWRRRGNELSLASNRTSVPALSARPLVRIGDAPGQQPLENPAAIQGTWVTDPTAADLIARQYPAAIRDSTGPLRITVHGSHCRWTQHTPDGINGGDDICRFAGDTLELDQLPLNAPPAVSTPMFLRWSVYHDELTFREAPGLSPAPWTFHPWRKVR